MLNLLKRIFAPTTAPAGGDTLRLYNSIRAKADRSALCHAPFKSMYFAQNGVVRACCYNRRFVLGYYPAEMPTDIWHNKNTNALRTALRHNNTDLGCYICAQKLNPAEYSAVAARQYDNLPPQAQHPHILEFECDTTCNLECVMCTGEYSSKIRTHREKQELLPNPYDDAFIENIKPWLRTIKDARFNGGEPFLSPLYHKIWAYILEHNPDCSISVQTNGTILNDTVKDFLHRGRFNISVSLDATDREVYNSIRTHASYDAVIANIDYFAAYCRGKNTYFGISACPMRINWKEMPSLLRFANEKNARIFYHTVFFPPALAIWNMEAHELEHIREYLGRFRWTAHSQLQEDNIKTFRMLSARIDDWHAAALNRVPTAGKTMPELTAMLHAALDAWCDSQGNETAATEALKQKYRNSVEAVLGSFAPDAQSACLREMLKAPAELLVASFESDSTDKIIRGLKDMFQ